MGFINTSDITAKLADAREFLTPLFRLEGNLDFKLDIGAKDITVNYSHEGVDLGYSSNLGIPVPDQGAVQGIGSAMLLAVNEKIRKKYNEFKEVDNIDGKMAIDWLQCIVGFVSEISYFRARGFEMEDPFVRDLEVPDKDSAYEDCADLLKEGKTREDFEKTFYLVTKKMDQLMKIAYRLYQLKGDEAIRDLSKLRFSKARDYIFEHTKMDFLDLNGKKV